MEQEGYLTLCMLSEEWGSSRIAATVLKKPKYVIQKLWPYLRSCPGGPKGKTTGKVTTTPEPLRLPEQESRCRAEGWFERMAKLVC